MQSLLDFLSPIDVSQLNDDNGYHHGQLANHINSFSTGLPDITDADIVLVGVCEVRGSGLPDKKDIVAANIIRKNLYLLNYWHPNVKIADIGNIKTGATLNDSYSAIKTVLAELIRQKKTVVIMGGSHDITLAQYYAYKELKLSTEATCIDANINLSGDSEARSENFLLEMLTSEPNLVKHYNHIGFQSYFVHPGILETLDKLRFDCFRLGVAKDNIEEMEPVIRNTNLLSFDISAIKYSDAPANECSPNGFSGEEACVLTRFAGMSNNLSSFGIYGYKPHLDVHELTAKQIAQMLWYFIDGKSRSKHESPIEERNNFNEFHTVFAEVETIFLQSKKSNRWWMQLPNKKFIACSYNDYVHASNNDIPERWLRAQERL
jgi:formiminoglutamase